MKTSCFRGLRADRARVPGINLLYFDHNATSPLAPEVAEVFAAASLEVYGNASSIHRAGQAARQHLETSRRAVAAFLHASPSEIVFTSGGTEANNLAILGLLRPSPGGSHIVTTAIEHPSVLEPIRQLERDGLHVTWLRPGPTGIVDIEELRRSLRDDTALVSVMHANNEIGTIQPLSEIAPLVLARRAAGQKLYLHSDGVQALGKIAVDLDALPLDLYSVSAHKIFGPKGIGALFVRKGSPLRALQFGGRHERERRPGTENVPAAVAFAYALALSTPDAAAELAQLRDRFEAQVLAYLPDVEINGAATPRLPNTSNLLFPGVSAEAMVIALDMKGMAVSTGSACSSGSLEPSHVLLAIGRSRDHAKSSIRFSFGRYNTPAEIDALTAAVVASARQLRRHQTAQEPHLARA